MWGRVRGWTARQPWLWAVAGAVIVWAITTAVAQGRGAFETLSSALQFATFYVIVGVGQMFVIASGPGNIDLSIPAVMTLAGYLAMGVMHGSDAGLWAGLAAGLGVGLAAGVGKIVLIRGVGHPPMIGKPRGGCRQHRPDPRARHPADDRHARGRLRRAVDHHRLLARLDREAGARPP